MSKKTTKTTARKATKRATGQTPESADSAAKTPTVRKLIPPPPRSWPRPASPWIARR